MAKGLSPSWGLILTNSFLIFWAAEARHCSHNGQNSPQSQRQHAGSNQCWLVFGEILGLSALFDSDFPVKAIPSHADLGLEGGNSHSCLSDSTVSSAGRKDPCRSREQSSERFQGADPGHHVPAGSRHPCNWVGTSSNIFLVWDRGPWCYFSSTAWT